MAPLILHRFFQALIFVDSHSIINSYSFYLQIILFNSKMAEYSEADVILAVQDVQNGWSLKKAAQRYGVPMTTLRRRIKGTEPRQLAYRYRTKLSTTQEDRLANWVVTQSLLANPPTHEVVRLFAQRMLTANSNDLRIGKHWLQCFLKRYPSIRTQRKRCIDSRRINNATEEVL